jgi:hypothetical protein
MPRKSSSRKISDLELAILRALCAMPNGWDEVARQLANYSWQEEDHEVVYKALRRVRGRGAKTLRDQLPAQTTRMGFPDIDWKIYFESERIQPFALERIWGELRILTAGKI